MGQLIITRRHEPPLDGQADTSWRRRHDRAANISRFMTTRRHAQRDFYSAFSRLRPPGHRLPRILASFEAISRPSAWGRALEVAVAEQATSLYFEEATWRDIGRASSAGTLGAPCRR